MFDDRLFDTIMEEMMSAFGADVRTDEGSLAYNACAKIADKLEEVYGDMDELNDNMLPDTQDIAHLIRYAEERGISYRHATAPVACGVFRQDIEDGERFTCGDYTYTVAGALEGAAYSYRMECETEGTEANTTFGELEPVEYIDGYLGGRITEILAPGVDDEEDEAFRSRVLQSFKTVAFGGNKADYRNFVNAIPGVGGCKPKRREQDSPWIEIYVISGDYLPPSEELISRIQTQVDPEQNSGEGDGMAPICHNVRICSAVPKNIDIAVTVSFDTGYGVETSGQTIGDAVSDYLAELRAGWESREMEDTVVRVSRIEARILSTEGVLDVSGTVLNGTAGNLLLDYTKIPVLGGVEIHV